MIRALLFGLFVCTTLPALSQDFFIVFLNKKDDKAALPEAEVSKLMEGHMANINRLAKEGKLWAAGPFDGGGGLFIFKTPSRDSVTRWIMTDPAVAANRWNVEIFPYQARTGSICTVGEKYEMTNYFFVRYVPSGPVSEKDLTAHLSHLRAAPGGLVAEAGLGDGAGSVAILRDEPATAFLNGDQLVSGEKSKVTVKKLFIARGSFCEPK